MTKEQAIDIIISEMPKDLKREHRFQKYEAFNLAVESLKYTPDDDCISRKAVMDILKNECSSIVETYLKEKIRGLPSAQFKPVVGEWIENNYGEICCCRCGYDISDEEQDVFEYWSYCPGCGALMGVEE